MLSTATKLKGDDPSLLLVFQIDHPIDTTGQDYMIIYLYKFSGTGVVSQDNRDQEFRQGDPVKLQLRYGGSNILFFLKTK